MSPHYRNVANWASGLILVVALFMSACKTQPTLYELNQATPDAKIALVSYSTNFLMSSLDGFEMAPRMDRLRGQAERSLGGTWELIPAAGFVTKPEYQSLPGNSQGVALPQIEGQPMKVFARERSELVAAQLDAQSAGALARLTGADLLAVIYVEWSFTGRMMDLHPLAKVVLSIYDAQGQRVYHTRHDERGVNKIKPVMFKSMVTEANLIEWVLPTEKAMAVIGSSAFAPPL